MRGYFLGQGFLEVETPARVRAPGQEVHLDAIAAPDGGDGRYLVTSPEYHMKRLCGAGFERIYQGTCLLARWPLQLAPGDGWSVTLCCEPRTTPSA